MSDKMPAGQVQSAGQQNLAMFTPEAQDILFKVTNMVVDVIESGWCFEILHEDMIIITEYFEAPRLSYTSLKPKTDPRVKK